MANVREIISRKRKIFEGEMIFTDANVVWLAGVLEGEFEFNHKYLNEEFYKNRLITLRESKETNDYTPIIIPDKIKAQISGSAKGKSVEIGGQYRSHNETDEEGVSHLKIYVYVKYLKVLEEPLIEDINAVYLEGYVCKKPTYRRTPFGKEITDLFLAVNLPYGKSAYLPCVAWGEGAEYASTLKVGDMVKIYALSQSRVYFKQTDLEELERRMTYELSIINFVS